MTKPDKNLARVVLRYGADVLLRDDNGSLFRATARRKLDKLACGDWVYYEDDGKSVVVTELKPRDNALVRTYFRGQPRTMAANIDQVLVITAPKPETDWSVVDGSLIAAERLGAEAIVVQHKYDMGSNEELEKRYEVYRKIGYRVPKTSIDAPDSIAELESLLSGKAAILLGQSGMGKSSLVDQLVSESKIKIGEISEISGLGKHTTSVTQLYEIPGGGFIIDSPGIRDFTPPPLAPEELQHAFREFEPFIGQCKFHNCQHEHEPGCAVLHAIEEGDISPLRHQSYLTHLNIWKEAEANPRR